MLISLALIPLLPPPPLPSLPRIPLPPFAPDKPRVASGLLDEEGAAKSIQGSAWDSQADCSRGAASCGPQWDGVRP